MTEEAQRKDAQLQEKREQVLLAKSEVDRVTGELMEARQMAQSLRSQLDSAVVCTFCVLDMHTTECGPPQAEIEDKSTQLLELVRSC